MKFLFVSPLGKAINPQTRYVGIERLVWEYARELVKTHDVTVMSRSDSIFPPEVKVFPYELKEGEDSNIHAELRHFQIYQRQFRDFDVIHDFSHQHLIARFMPAMPTLNIFWHAPALAQYPKAPYNIIGLSHWACREFERIYHQKARYQQSICLDTSLYRLSNKHRGNRFLVVGRMGPEKGNLNAASLCQQLRLELDILTARAGNQTDPLTDYEEAVLKIADGKRIKIWWENDYTEAIKIKLMQTTRGLLYITDHPEVTSHKLQEAMLSGASVIVPAIGALPEIITHGVDGYLCRNEAEFVIAINNIDKLNPASNNANLVRRYSVKNVVKDYMPLYTRVANGERW